MLISHHIITHSSFIDLQIAIHIASAVVVQGTRTSQNFDTFFQVKSVALCTLSMTVL
jgi:hypothetical protein